MPFANAAQRAACYAQQSAALKAGYEPKWKCHAYGEKKKRSESKKSVKRLRGGGTKSKRKIQVGPRGGRYVKLGKEKVHIGKKKTTKKPKLFVGPNGGRYFKRKGKDGTIYRTYV